MEWQKEASWEAVTQPESSNRAAVRIVRTHLRPFAADDDNGVIIAVAVVVDFGVFFCCVGMMPWLVTSNIDSVTSTQEGNLEIVVGEKILKSQSPLLSVRTTEGLYDRRSSQVRSPVSSTSEIPSHENYSCFPCLTISTNDDKSTHCMQYNLCSSPTKWSWSVGML